MASKNLQGAIRKISLSIFAREVSYMKNKTKKNVLQTGNGKKKHIVYQMIFVSLIDIHFSFQNES